MRARARARSTEARQSAHARPATGAPQRGSAAARARGEVLVCVRACVRAFVRDARLFSRESQGGGARRGRPVLPITSTLLHISAVAERAPTAGRRGGPVLYMLRPPPPYTPRHLRLPLSRAQVKRSRGVCVHVIPPPSLNPFAMDNGRTKAERAPGSPAAL